MTEQPTKPLTPAERLDLHGHGPPAASAPAADQLKPINLILAWHGPLKRYEVINITETTYYKPGQFIPEDEVTHLCSYIHDTNGQLIPRYPHWHVSMSQFDIFAFIGKLTGILPIHLT